MLRITPGHYANIAEKDTLFKDREPPKTIPYSAARIYIAHIGPANCPFSLSETELLSITYKLLTSLIRLYLHY